MWGRSYRQKLEGGEGQSVKGYECLTKATTLFKMGKKKMGSDFDDKGIQTTSGCT